MNEHHARRSCPGFGVKGVRERGAVRQRERALVLRGCLHRYSLSQCVRMPGVSLSPAVARLAELTAELDGQLAELDRVLATELAAFNELVRSKGAPAVLVPSGDKAPPQR